MRASTLLDLDELVLRCRDDESRGYIAEAVACYKAGAYRSCIVLTWIAVVLDFMYKMRDLSLANNGTARQLVEQYERVRAAGAAGVPEAQRFEASVVKRAADDFALLTPIETADLERLHQDRHRCAHPTMQSIEDPYTPPAELARLHLRNAVEYMLERPPVQGKAALDEIWAEIRSSYFPVDSTQAKDALRTGPLGRARPSLVRSVILGLVRSYFREAHSKQERARMMAAIEAIRQLYPEGVETVLSAELPGLIRVLAEDAWWTVPELCRGCPVCWSAIGEPMREKAGRVVGEIGELNCADYLDAAYDIADMNGAVVARLPDLPPATLLALISREARPEYCEVAVNKFAAVYSYGEIRVFRGILRSGVIASLQDGQIQRVVQALADNHSIRQYAGWLGMIQEILEGLSPAQQLASAQQWRAVFEQLCTPRYQARGAECRALLCRTFAELTEPRWPDDREGRDDANDEG